ncbi:hypothetical protein AAFP30_08435 [Gordonia sp. CPCC 205515]|uniref:hypothetical protein n=1 Tax=Gordonia sp. CPCC 205515 TaxID=3140791 RepID=UPI003AF3D6AA
MGLREVHSSPGRFGAPVVVDERTTIIPVSRRGLFGRPVAVGAFTVSDGRTTWTPIVDQGRVALIGVVTGLVAAALCSAAVYKRPPWPAMTIVEDRTPYRVSGGTNTMP